jgi:hypothetical protein
LKTQALEKEIAILS